MNNNHFTPTQLNMNPINKLYRVFKPSNNLRKYICCYWITPSYKDLINYNLINSLDETIIPDGCVDLLLDCHNTSHRNIIVGATEKPIMVNMKYDTIQTFGIRFFPGGLQAFFPENASAFTNKIISINSIGNNLFNELMDQINRFSDTQEKIHFLDQFFSLRLNNFIQWESDFQNIMRYIINSKGNIKVKDIAAALVISEKQITRIFNYRVGLNTKQFIKIIRFQNVLQMINTQSNLKITDVFNESGYYDQSHFIHDFFSFTLINPTDYKNLKKEN